MSQAPLAIDSIFQDHLPQLRQMAFRDALINEHIPDVTDALLVTQPMLVVLCFPFDYPNSTDERAFQDALHTAGHLTEHLEILHMGSHLAMIIKGEGNIQKFREMFSLSPENTRLDPHFHPVLLPYYVTAGRVVQAPNQLYRSYQDAWWLMQQRFFHPHNQHLLQYEEGLHREDLPKVITGLLLQEYTTRLLQYIQAFNRALVSASLQELQQRLLDSSNDPDEIRLFLSDLYLQIKEQIRFLYQGHSIPFYSNTHIIRTIQQATHLSDIIMFLAQRFDMIMSSIGESSRESVLNDILRYIRHNYNTNITLESIAPLFGYNHSYLGKIFRKKMNQSFNEYVDRLRIEKAKELLLTTEYKVYFIAEQVGYKNVDYFHVKFRKYVSMSPAEFRKNSQIASHSPEGENVGKGPLSP